MDLFKHLIFTYEQPQVFFIVFEDNAAVLELANAPKIHPWIKNIALKYHHFLERVKKKTIISIAVEAKNRIVDMFTKESAFVDIGKHQKPFTCLVNFCV